MPKSTTVSAPGRGPAFLGLLLAMALTAGAYARPATTQPGTQPATAPAMRDMSAGELDRLLADLEKNLAPLRALRVRFVQHKHLAILREPLEARGEILFARPDKTRFEYTRPYRSVTLTDGRASARFEETPTGWRKVRIPAEALRAATGQIAAWLRGRFDTDEGLYDIAGRTGGQTVLILRPRKAELRKHIRAIELTVSPNRDGFERMVIRETEGDYTVLRFVSAWRNPPLPDALFDTTSAVPAPLPPLPQPATAPATAPAAEAEE